ncbi:MAG: nucleotide exchange factor GrpE [Bacteroidia bacterium]|nr:nucleotide exchange factor GrpE [Bacteroidia bacterium]
MKKNATEGQDIQNQSTNATGVDENPAENPSFPNENALPDAETAETDPLAKLQAELSATQDKYLRLYSEFENYKKRIARDRIEQGKMASAEAYLTILPMIDDLERIIKSFDENPETASLREGITLVFNKIKSMMESRGLVAMNSLGTPFDPELHDAISGVPAPSESMKGKVVDVIEKGYFLNERVIRHAKVVVGS